MVMQKNHLVRGSRRSIKDYPTLHIRDVQVLIIW
jgi:hypothetical protein